MEQSSSYDELTVMHQFDRKCKLALDGGFRMTMEEYEKLTKYAEEHNLTITEVLHKGVHLLYRTS